LELYFADIEGEDYREDDLLYGFDDDELQGTFDDFEYYISSHDPGGDLGGDLSLE